MKMLSHFKIRLVPLAVALAAVAFGAHAAEAVKSATATAKPAAPAKAAPMPQSRSEVRFGEEIRDNAPAPEDRARQIELRERLAEAAEKRIDSKLNELRSREAVQTQQQQVRKEAVNQQLASLVKVYESMKPKDAARIMEKLDLPVQLAVASKMKEAKMAAILSQMTPDGAKALTMQLAIKANIDG